MVAAKYNIVIARGASFSLPIALTDTSGSASNLTGYTVKSQIRKEYGLPPVMSFTVTGTLDTSGKFSLTLLPAQTASLSVGAYVWDCLLEINGEVDPLVGGGVTVTPLVTQP